MKDYCVGFQSDSALAPEDEITLEAPLRNAFLVREIIFPPENGARLVRVTADGGSREAKLETMITGVALWRVPLADLFLAEHSLSIVVRGLRPVAIVRAAAVGPLATIGEIEAAHARRGLQ
jgi:hypothetical protein